VSAETIFDQLDPVLTRWTVGGQASVLAPVAWQDAPSAASGEEAELRLLALAGHYLDLCVTPTPATQLIALPELPTLAWPIVPEGQRSLVRRCLKSFKDHKTRGDMVAMLATRGYVIHPADWMPSQSDEAIPDIYAAWRDWATAQAAQNRNNAKEHDALTAENWDEWWPAARMNALKALRARAPEQALAVLTEKAAGEAADTRLRLIECLVARLSDQDIPYLESLSTDRAPKIKALAASLLARLGRQSANLEDSAELATFFEFQTKGIFRKTRFLVPREIKTPAQRATREALFARVDFLTFSHSLGVTPAELIAMWPLALDHDADQDFGALCERSAPDVNFDALFARLVQESEIHLYVIYALQSRLNKDQGRAFAMRILVDRTGSFRAALRVSGPDLDLRKFLDTQRGRDMLTACAGDNDVTNDAHALGLIASQASAAYALELLTRQGSPSGGLMISDPRLNLLRLNAALAHTGVST
jgi:Family of unknown function (DUF5691)